MFPTIHSMDIINARETLKFCRAKIEREKPKTSEIEDSVAGILVASDQTDWKRIKFYNGNMKKRIREHFEKYQKRLDVVTLPVEGSKKTYGPPYDNVLGLYWHKLLSSNLKGERTEEEDDDELAKCMFQWLKRQFGIRLIDCEFPLYGYVYNKEETASNVYLWQNAKADAIGWYFDETKERFKYVIVDWKVVDLLKFWTNAKTYGCFLHQSLIYARLLQLHLGLDYIPPILLVPISNNNGRDIQPGLFCDYPEECKSAINDDCWSTTLPKRPQKIKGQWPLNVCNLEDGPVDKKMLLTDFFDNDAKVEDLLEAFGWSSIEVYDCKRPSPSTLPSPLPQQAPYNPLQPLYNLRQPLYNPLQPLYNLRQPLYNLRQPLYNPLQPLYNLRQPLFYS